MTLPTAQTLAKVFSDGADARLAGLGLEDCPHHIDSEANRVVRRQWIAGWRDVHYSWGRGTKGRWRVKPIPDLRMADA